MEGIGKEYVQRVLLEGGFAMLSQVRLEESGVGVLVRAGERGEESGVDYETTVRTVTRALDCVSSMSKQAAEGVGVDPVQAQAVAERVRKKMESFLVDEGVVASAGGNDLTTSAAGTFVFANIKSHVDVPESVGGLPLKDVACYNEAGSMMFAWRFEWSDDEDLITTEMRIPLIDLRMDYNVVVRKLQIMMDEKVAELKARYPGDFEVECVDATGLEYHFDEGMTYLAEDSLDDCMLCVWDRHGKRGQFMKCRFSRVEKVTAKVLKNRKAKNDDCFTFSGEMSVGRPTGGLEGFKRFFDGEVEGSS